FIIIGSMNPEEGELRPQLIDRIGLMVKVEGIKDVEQRMEIIRRQREFISDPEGFRRKYEAEQHALRERIKKARELLPSVITPPKLLEIIGKLCIDFNVQGHRADIIIERAARAHAAFNGRLETTVDDVIIAAELALPHRMRRMPLEEEEFSAEMLRKLIRSYMVE
ncbi:MAG: magnesium chelatase, partial [Thermoplasmata archaeon]